MPAGATNTVLFRPKVHQKITAAISFLPVTVQEPCVSVTVPQNRSEIGVHASENRFFAQAPAQVTVRYPSVMREVTQVFVLFASVENA